jgi:hypothetical protein
MRSIILATLTTSFLLGGAQIAFADCQTLAQAKASNPTAHLIYRTVAGARCWSAEDPADRGLRIVRKKAGLVSPPAKADRSDQPLPAQALPDVKNERKVVEPSSGGLEKAQATREVADAVDVVGSDMRSISASPLRTPTPADGAVEVLETRQSRAPAPTRAAARYPALAVWLPLTVAIGAAMIVILKLNAARPVRSPALWQGARRIRMRDHASAATPLVDHVDTRILDRNVVASPTADARPWSKPRPRYAIGTWPGPPDERT